MVTAFIEENASDTYLNNVKNLYEIINSVVLYANEKNEIIHLLKNVFNSTKILYETIYNSEIKENEKCEVYDLLIKILTAELKYITEVEKKELTEIVEIFECSICMEQIVCEETTSCGHKFHKNCIDYWCRSNNSCPICRTTNPLSIL